MVKGALIIRPSVRKRRGSAITVADVVCQLMDYVTIALPDVEPVTQEKRESVERVIVDALNNPPRGFSGQVRKAARATRNASGAIPIISEYLCSVWNSVGAFGGCDQGTISAEVAERKKTTVQGAHAWMVRPFTLTPALSVPTNLILRSEAGNACRERGAAGVDEMLRFYQAPIYVRERELLEQVKRRCNDG